MIHSFSLASVVLMT